MDFPKYHAIRNFCLTGEYPDENCPYFSTRKNWRRYCRNFNVWFNHLYRHNLLVVVDSEMFLIFNGIHQCPQGRDKCWASFKNDFWNPRGYVTISELLKKCPYCSMVRR